MRRSLTLLACVIALLSVAVLADSIPPDPSGIGRNGTYYWVTPFNITSATIPSFNPFTASFCEQNQTQVFDGVTYKGPACAFTNGFQDITNLLLTFPTQIGTISCINLVSASPTDCVDTTTSILFKMFDIPKGGHFNILFAGKVINGTLTDTWANTSGYGVNPLPEPAPAALLAGGFGTLFGLLSRKRYSDI